ncbi:MAG: serine/threonine-protein kinase [Acidobacteriota bacterium]|nr:serine/threonine-protein kinase [Acidobacteriota bacterium]
MTRTCRKAEATPTASRSPRTLPPDLLAAGVRRLGYVALLTASVSIVFSVVLRLVAMQAGQPPYAGIVLFGEVAAVVASLGTFALTRRAGLDPAEVLDRALVFEVAMGFLFAIIYHSVPAAAGVLPKGWSSVAVWLMAFPLLVPSTRGKTTIATFATALMDPLGLLVSVSLGQQPAPGAAAAIAMFLPTAVACVIALVGSRIVYRLTAEAGRAEELGSYRLVSLLGQGGMGEVWRAEHRMLARDAAIKLVRGGSDLSGRELMARFEREAKVTAGLRSPHTVQLYDFGRSDDGAFYIVMELLEGFPLDEILRRFGPLAPGRVVHVMTQVCHSLAEAHAAGLVHRDIKPGNIFLGRYGGDPDFVKVLDFGLVKTLSAAGADLTETGILAGTPGYMPPEMALGRAVDGRTDLYALGAVGYTLLTGLAVFERATALETIHDHASTIPIPPSRRVATPIPPGLERVLLDCLAKEPGERPQSARALAARLAEIDLPEPWNREEAERWWNRNAPS